MGCLNLHWLSPLYYNHTVVRYVVSKSGQIKCKKAMIFYIFMQIFISEKDFCWIHFRLEVFNLEGSIDKSTIDSTLDSVSVILITWKHLFRGKCEKCKGLTMCNKWKRTKKEAFTKSSRSNWTSRFAKKTLQRLDFVCPFRYSFTYLFYI